MNDQEDKLAIKIMWQDEYPLSHERLVEILKEFGDLFPDPLQRRVDLYNYAKKLIKFADLQVALVNQEIVGFLAVYANNKQTHVAHIPLIAILKRYQRIGIGKVMLSRTIALARQRKMKHIWLSVMKENSAAIQFYHSIRFVIRSEKGQKYSMERDLSIEERLINPQVTPVDHGYPLSATLNLNIDLRIKRDDLYPLSGGGIKARKIGYIVKKAIDEGYDALVTNGGPQSNHARATAILAANLGIKCHLVIILEKEKTYLNNGNMLLMKLSGSSIEYTTKEQLALRMDEAIVDLTNKGHKPLYIWGGGHCLEGTKAFVDAAVECQHQSGDWIPDFLILASGTGSTQAGLAIGYMDLPTQVIGVSVARSTDRGKSIIQDCIDEYYSHYHLTQHPNHVFFRDDWTDGGYEQYSKELFHLIRTAAKTGYFFDPTYSGKALRGLVSMVKKNEIPESSKVLFWHSGGLMNLQAVHEFSAGFIKL
jgi:1-aminocyclopropane-1-carboxylate deaminase/D-cysteine desulfhydrase-like pyridoxal-dependent ACC family enzyme/ribosomal protein S18 acetylase RimI-like enzyme